MLDNLIKRLFPCEKIAKRIMKDHEESMKNNKEAHERLIRMCDPDGCNLQKIPNIFLKRKDNDVCTQQEEPI